MVTLHRSRSDEEILADSIDSTKLRRTQENPYQHRIIELERENSRLHRLVAELLLKNQQLRRLGEQL